MPLQLVSEQSGLETEADMDASAPRTERVQSASQALALGFFYLGMVTFLGYVLFEALESGIF